MMAGDDSGSIEAQPIPTHRQSPASGLPQRSVPELESADFEVFMSFGKESSLAKWPEIIKISGAELGI